eukprot:g3271.t1
MVTIRRENMASRGAVLGVLLVGLITFGAGSCSLHFIGYMRSESRLMRKAEQHEVNREETPVEGQGIERCHVLCRTSMFGIRPVKSCPWTCENCSSLTPTLNYTFLDFEFKDMPSAARLTGVLEKIIVVPPLNRDLACLGKLVGYTCVTRFPWKVATTGLVVWIDPDGWKRWDVVQRDKVRKKKFPKKKSIFGPDQPTDFTLFTPKNLDAGDPIDMWQEADVHVDLQARPNMKVADNIMASVIDAILRSPPKWRNWMKAGKIRGTVPSDYETPYQVRREFHSYGVSPRLNKLLKA